MGVTGDSSFLKDNTVQRKEIGDPCGGSTLFSSCAVSLLRDHFHRSRTASRDDFLFMVPKGKEAGASPVFLCLQENQILVGIVCLSKDIGFHSLHRGAATHMSILGVKLEDIRAADLSYYPSIPHNEC